MKVAHNYDVHPHKILLIKGFSDHSLPYLSSFLSNILVRLFWLI